MRLTVTITVGLFHLITLLASRGLRNVSLCYLNAYIDNIELATATMSFGWRWLANFSAA